MSYSSKEEAIKAWREKKDQILNKKSGGSNQSETKARVLFYSSETPATVRIVPDFDNPFLLKEESLYFYNSTQLKTQNGKYENNLRLLSPRSYSGDDGIKVVLDGILNLENVSSEIKTEISKKLRETTYFYLPIIVRGQESEGVKLWRLTPTAFDDLSLNLLKNDEFIYDPRNGCDIQTWTAMESGSNGRTWPKTHFRILDQSPITTSKELVEVMRNQIPTALDQYSKTPFNKQKDIALEVASQYIPNLRSGMDNQEDTHIEKTAEVQDHRPVVESVPNVEQPATDSVEDFFKEKETTPQAPVQESKDDFGDLPF